MNPVPCVTDEWMTEGACYRSDTTVFFDDPDEARAICATCPVIDLCAGYALTCREKDGVWGGLTEGQRRVMKWPWRACKWRKCRRIFDRTVSPAPFFCSEECRDARGSEKAEEARERLQRWHAGA